jgi:hypothetical protein
MKLDDTQHYPLRALRPTQMTFGMREVESRGLTWRNASGKERKALLEGHIAPAVLGPDQAVFLIDHHHFALSLLREGEVAMLARCEHDFSHLQSDEFWMVMEFYGFAHPFDANGVRQPFSAMPEMLVDGTDDVFRSLVWAVRQVNGITKATIPYAEFIWADFFRRRLSLQSVNEGFDKATRLAKELAVSSQASHLPGFTK